MIDYTSWVRTLNGRSLVDELEMLYAATNYIYSESARGRQIARSSLLIVQGRTTIVENEFAKRLQTFTGKNSERGIMPRLSLM